MIPLANKASGQVTVVDITDAYSVLLTSESYTFVGNTTGAPSGLSCTTQALAYCGTQQCSNVSVSTVTCPAGISAIISNNNTVSPTITFKTTATITAACEATIPVTVDGVTINKKFSFAVAKTGATGDKGDTGKSVSSVTTQYYVSTSKTSATGGSWSDTAPTTIEKGKYLWTRLKIVYTNPSSTEYTTATYNSMTDSRIEQLKDSITLEITGPDGVKSSIAMDDDGKIALTGEVMAQRINVNELMARKLTSTGGLDVTGDFYVKNTFGAITQATNDEGYNLTTITGYTDNEDGRYESNISSGSQSIVLRTTSTPPVGSEEDPSFPSDNSYIRIGGGLTFMTPGELTMFSTRGVNISTDEGYDISLGGDTTVYGTLAASDWGYKKTITVGGDLNTYYPVHIYSSCFDNDRELHLYIGKKLFSTSPAWSGNHPIGSSSLAIGWAYRASGWDGNGDYYRTLYKNEKYAKLISHIEFMTGQVRGAVVWLRGGGATYDIRSDVPFTSSVYLSNTDITMTSGYSYIVGPRTDIDNAGFIGYNSGFASYVIDTYDYKTPITVSWAESAKSYTNYFACWSEAGHISNINATNARLSMGIDFGTWTPMLDNCSATHTEQHGWYMLIGNVAIIGWNLYAEYHGAGYGGATYMIKGVPWYPLYDAAGGGTLSGYYSSSQVGFSGWKIRKSNGEIYAMSVQPNSAGNKWSEFNIGHGISETSASGTIVFTIDSSR